MNKAYKFKLKALESERDHLKDTIELLFKVLSLKLEKVEGLERVIDIVYEYFDLLDLLHVKKGIPKLYKLQGFTELETYDEGLMLRYSDSCLSLLKQMITDNARSPVALTQ